MQHIGRFACSLIAVASIVVSIVAVPAGAEEHGEDQASESDREALVALYEATGGESWNDSGGWLGDGPLGGWYGVTADDDDRVIALSLASNGLVGELPAELGSLEHLEILDLGNNDLVGELPPS